MSANTHTKSLLRNLFIASDFFVFNVLWLIYVEIPYIRFHLSAGADLLLVWLLMNVSFLLSQVFFSNVVHSHRSTPVQILRQVASLVLLWAAFNYFITELVLGYMHRQVPDVRFTLYYLPPLFLAIILSRFAERWMLSLYRKRGRNIRQVLFVGNGGGLLPIFNYLIGDPSLGYRSKGYFADEPLADCPDTLVRRGTLDDLRRIMERGIEPGLVDEVFCSLGEGDKDLTRTLMHFCNENVVHFYYVPSFSGLFGHSLRQDVVGETSVFTNYDEPLLRQTNKVMKRTFDIVVSGLTLICLLPFIPLIALIIKVQSPGPVFFRQERTGVNGRSFYCYKFRSMHVNKDADRLQATKDDPRKFPFGNFMRRTNIDELPQFFNVFVGNMSIVGPRPHMLHHTEVYRKLVDHYMVRHFVKPGITGWAQVTGYRGETKELWQMEGRVQRDIWYIEHWSIWLDLYIIWKTAKQLVIPDKNAY